MSCICPVEPGDKAKKPCPRHGIDKGPRWRRLCSQGGAYFEAWEQGRGPGQDRSESPPLMYAILATARSGSTFLCDLLTSTGRLGKPLEYCNPVWRKEAGVRRDLSPFDLMRKSAVGNVFAVKVTQPLHLPALKDFGVARFVRLRRRDLSAQAVSRYIAQKTHKWQITHLDQAPPLPPFDEAKIRHWGAETLKAERIFNQYVVGKKVLDLWYEDVCEDPAGAVRSIAEFLGVPLDGVPDEQIRSPRPIVRTPETEEWARRVALEPLPPPGEYLLPIVDDYPCRHRGRLLGDGYCKPCQSRTGQETHLPVYACDKLVSCTAGTQILFRGRYTRSCNLCEIRPESPPAPKPLSRRALKGFFDRVVVLSLKRRADRLAEFRKRIDTMDWPFRKPEVFIGVDGHRVPVPVGWNHGGGTWGCMQGHREILERAIQDGIGRILVLEDDCVFREGFAENVAKFLAAVPDDWDALMPGGQHLWQFENPPRWVRPGVMRCENAQRTHAYALRGSTIGDLYRHWISNAGHCDHLMGPFLGKRNTFAPTPFLAGQAAGWSDINGGYHQPKFFDRPREGAKVLLLIGQKASVDRCRKVGAHIGYRFDDDKITPLGLPWVFRQSRNAEELGGRLRTWLLTVEQEAWAMQWSLPAIWMPDMKPAEVASVHEAIGPRVVEIVDPEPDGLEELIRAERKPRWAWSEAG